MPKTKITATFGNGTTVVRSTEAAYFYAVKRNVGTQAGRVPTITFHRTEEQARAIAGKRGEVVRTDYGTTDHERSCAVCSNDPRGVPSVSAVTNQVSWVPCWGNAHR